MLLFSEAVLMLQIISSYSDYFYDVPLLFFDYVLLLLLLAQYTILKVPIIYSRRTWIIHEVTVIAAIWKG